MGWFHCSLQSTNQMRTVLFFFFSLRHSKSKLFHIIFSVYYYIIYTSKTTVYKVSIYSANWTASTFLVINPSRSTLICIHTSELVKAIMYHFDKSLIRQLNPKFQSYHSLKTSSCNLSLINPYCSGNWHVLHVNF